MQDPVGLYEGPFKAGKDCQTDIPREFAIQFAKTVTCASNDADKYWVAKNGDSSIFTAFRRIFPNVSSLCLWMI